MLNDVLQLVAEPQDQGTYQRNRTLPSACSTDPMLHTGSICRSYPLQAAPCSIALAIVS